MSVRNLISVGDMNRQLWDELYGSCRSIIANPGDYADSCRGKLMASLFYEPSTRTNFSFQAAMLRLGGTTFGFSDPAGTSVSKGETLSDTVRIAASYSDTLVIRSPHEGAALAATLYSDVPVINAGDGGHFHPTQTLADLTTIAEKRGGIENFRIGMCGDLKYGRTVHSLVSALSMFPGIRFYLISPRELRLPDYMLRLMRHHGQSYVESESLAECMPELDILYMTRTQRERFRSAAEYERLRHVYILTTKLLKSASPDMLVMHPLPRSGEIEQEVDEDPRSVYFEQARYGLFIRMALLLKFAHLPRETPQIAGPWRTSDSKCLNQACIAQAEPYLPRLAHVSVNGSPRCAYCDEKILAF